MEKSNKRGHGGSRPGAGRPKTVKSWSEKFKRNLWRAIDKKAKETGKSFFEVLADELMTPKRHTANAYASLVKTVCDVMAARETVSKVEKVEYGPVIGLPAVKSKDDDDSPKIVTRPN